MPDFRSFVRSGEIDGDTIRLSLRESQHLVAANRARKGDPVTGFDGYGNEFDCELVEADRKAAVLEVRNRTSRDPLPYALTLAQAVPKGKTFEGIIRHATEIGVARIVPLVTERTEVRPAGGRREQKDGKWRTAAIEAAKQSGNPFVPEVLPPVGLDDFLRRGGDWDLRLVAALTPAAVSLRQLFPDAISGTPGHPYRIVWLVGPEGDFSTGELESAEKHGFHPVSLGPYVLRSETAALCALALAAHELRNRL